MKIDYMFPITSVRANDLNKQLQNIVTVSYFEVKLHDRTCTNSLEGKKYTYVAINDVLDLKEGTAILLQSNY
jgi:hypothetical protein